MNKNVVLIGAGAIGIIALVFFMKRNKSSEKSLDTQTSGTDSKETTDKEDVKEKPSKRGKIPLSNVKQIQGQIQSYQTIAPISNTKGSVTNINSEDIDYSQPSRRDCRKEAREQGIKDYQIRKMINYVNQCKREGGVDSGFDGSYNFNTSAFDTDTEQFAFNGHTF
jgi:hypothetical protein